MAIEKADLKQIYDTHQQAMFNFALRWVFDFSLAEELVHESFLALWEKRDSIEKIKVKSYLFKTIQNKAINWRRKQKFLNAFSLVENEVEDSQNLQESQIALNQELIEMREALENLPMNYRKVLLLSFYGEFSYQEISEQLCISEGTVASRKSRAIEMLRVKLKVGSEYAI